jgi:hypothetical protein
MNLKTGLRHWKARVNPLSNLRLRLEKLEAKSAAKEHVFGQAVLIGVFGNDHNVAGAGILGRTVKREENETVEALTSRASRILGMQFLFAIYADGTEAC